MLTNIIPWWFWITFFAIILGMLAIDLFVLGGKKVHKVSVKEALSWTIVWVIVAMLFNGGLWWYLNSTQGAEIATKTSLEFLAGYLLEKSLAVDNVFVWLMIFGFFAVPEQYQRRVLLYGVLGAIILRTIMIFSGTWLINQFDWILYIFGAFLIFTAIKMLIVAESEPDLENNGLMKWMRRKFRVTEQFVDEKFLVKRNGLWFVTPLFLVLVLVEISDVIFAVDSIPAVFAITTDPFIVLTSNIFAILGLRALYFLVLNVADKFHLLKYGVSVVLIFVGAKMLLVHHYKVPIAISLGVIGGILAVSMIASVLIPPKKEDAEKASNKV